MEVEVADGEFGMRIILGPDDYAGMKASASISMRHAGLSRAAMTTMVAAGRILAKNWPWMRPASCQSST